jgi:hypothetical protein
MSQRKKKDDLPVWTHYKDTCDCVRCTGFLPGHPDYGGHAKPTHGAYQTPLKLKPETEALAEMLRPLMPVWHPGYEATLQNYCIQLIRIQRASDALDAVEDGTWEEKYGDAKPPSQALAEDLRRWQSLALKYAQQLGLTPASMAQIVRDAKGGDREVFRNPTQDELSRVPLAKLRGLQRALTEALADDTIDVEVA